LIVASLFCMLVFLMYIILSELFNVNLKIINAVYLVLSPLSILSIVLFLILYLFSKKK
jgi:hypothetical protein